MLYPQTNLCRTAIGLDGFWDFQIDPEGRGEQEAWWQGLPAPHLMAVPGSWNEVRPEYRDYLDDAWYTCTFMVPQAWAGLRVVLRFGSVTYHARVWLNGECLGEHEGGHLPFEFVDITSAAVPGMNRLAVKVNNTLRPDRVPTGNSPDSPMSSFMRTYPRTNFDFFPYAGIHRPVILYATAQTCIHRLQVHTDFERQHGADDLTGWLDIRADVSLAAQAQLFCAVRAGMEAVVSQPIALEGTTGRGRIRIPGARLWSPESPFLYQCDFTLQDGNGTVLDQYLLEIGIRTVQIQEDQILLNGEPIFLKGFGKHEDFPVYGRALSMPLIARDGALFEWLGANSYRTAHYPYAEEAMMHADRTGLLIIDEIPAVGLMFDDSDENVAARLRICRQQLEDLIARDINHPSVIMWSVANEPFPPKLMQRFQGQEVDPDLDEPGTRFFETLIAHGRRLDDSRPFSLAGIMGCPLAWLALCDVVMVNRYWGWYIHGGEPERGRETMAEELDMLHGRLGKPIVVSEFGADALAGQHSMPAEMFSEEYQAEVLRHYLDVAADRPFVAGLHVWNFADFKTGQGVMRPNAMNYKGVFTRDRRPKMAAHLLRTRWAGTTDS